MTRDHRKEAFDFFNKVKELRTLVIHYNMETDPEVEKMSKHTQVDVGFFYREAEDLLDEMRKEMLARREKLGKLLATTVYQEAMTAGSTDTTCVGNFATAKVDVKTLPVMPKRGTEEYQKLMLSMGVASEIVDHGVLEPHFVRLGEYLTTKAAAGLSPLKNVLTTREELTVSYRKKK